MPNKTPRPLMGVSLLQQVNSAQAAPARPREEEEKPEVRAGAVATETAQEATEAAAQAMTVPALTDVPEGPAPILVRDPAIIPGPAAVPGPRKTGAVGRPPVQKDKEQVQLASTTKSVRVAAGVHKKLMHAALDLDIDFSLLVNRILSDWARRHSRREAQLPPPLA